MKELVVIQKGESASLVQGLEGEKMSLAKKLKSKGLKKLPQRKPNRLLFECQSCGKVVEAEARLVLSGRKRFCSRSCRSKFVCTITHKARDLIRPDLDQIRFWKKVRKTSSCWIWTGGLFTNGYGQFWRVEGSMPAHRYSWALVHGFENLVEESQICHKCDNPLCVNPTHLFLGTALINKLDSMSKDRHARGERTNTAKLTEELVIRGRELLASGKTVNEIYHLLDPPVTLGNFRAAVTKAAWRHL